MTQTTSKPSLGVTDAQIARISEDRKSGVIRIMVTHRDIQQFAPSVEALMDVNMNGDYWPHLNLALAVTAQYERRWFPVIQPGAESNIVPSIEIQTRPQKLPAPWAFPLAQNATGGGRPN